MVEQEINYIMMLTYLVYLSQRNPICTDQEIDKILNSCKKNNKDKDITGVLLYSKTKFLQYLEGDYKLIYSLYDKIKTDPRHKNINLISTKPIKERLFPSWQMAGKEISENPQFLTQLSTNEKIEFEQILSGKEDNNAYKIIQKFFL